MRQEQEIKGFTIFELLVVIAIIGIISAVGYPNFSNWNKEREVRVGTENIFSLMNNIVAQTKRGNYAYVQVEVSFPSNQLTFVSKGMKKDTMGKELNKPAKSRKLNCDSQVPWDNVLINKYEPEIISINFNENGAVCFSQDGTYYKIEGKITKNINLFIENRKLGKKDYIIICHQKDAIKNICPAQKSLTKDQPAYLIEWSRFGTLSKFKWDGNAWRRL